MFGLIVHWTIPAEHREAVLAGLSRMIELVAANEPGCLVYQANISQANPDQVVLYERYVDEAAFDFHCNTEYFKRIVIGEIVPLLAHREREVLIPVHSSNG
jgi:quinol monooxygenase YgiN